MTDIRVGSRSTTIHDLRFTVHGVSCYWPRRNAVNEGRRGGVSFVLRRVGVCVSIKSEDRDGEENARPDVGVEGSLAGRD